MNNPERPSHAIAVGALVLCCVMWGFSFPAMKMSAAVIDRVAVDVNSAALRASYNAWRFGLAALGYALLIRARPSSFTRADLKGGVLVGLFFGGGIFFQLMGLRYARPSISAFLTSGGVVFTPIAQFLFLRRRVGKRTWYFVAMAFIGALILTLGSQSDQSASAVVPPVRNLGEWLTLLSAVLFTGQILAVDAYGKSVDANRLTLVMLATTAAVNFAGAMALGGTGIFRGHLLSELVRDRNFVLLFSVLVIFSGILAMHLMNRYQPFVAPAAAAVIYCAEAVCATLFSLAFGTEHLNLALVLGGAIILRAVVGVSRETATVESPIELPSQAVIIEDLPQRIE